MSPRLTPLLGWGAAVATVALGHVLYGWRGVLLAMSIVVFWLLLQFTQALRAMRQAGQAPVGLVPSAVMLQARLHPGMRLLQVIQITRSLGRPVSDAPEVWAWQDESGAEVQVVLERGRLARSTLHRPDTATDTAAHTAASAEPGNMGPAQTAPAPTAPAPPSAA